MTDIADNIQAAVQLMGRLGNELVAMMKGLEDVANDNATRKQSTVWFQRRDKTDADSDNYDGGGQWVFAGDRWDFLTSRKNRRGRNTELGVLSICVDLWAEDRPSADLGIPCVIVTWGPTGDGFAEMLDGTDPDKFWTPSLYTLRSEGRLLWYLGPKDSDDFPEYVKNEIPNEGAWAYLLPLTDITSTEKLKTLIIEPVSKLLESEKGPEVDVVDAFNGVSNVLRFKFDNNDRPTRFEQIK